MRRKDPGRGTADEPEIPLRDGLSERLGPLAVERGGDARQAAADEVEREHLAAGGDGAGMESPSPEPQHAGLTS